MRRAVITGIGVITAIGRNLKEYWDSLSNGLCGIGEVTLFDTSGYRGKLAAQISEIPPVQTNGIRRLSRCDLLGLVAWNEARKDCRFDELKLSPDRIGVCIGGGSGGLLSTELFRRTQKEKGKAPPSLLFPFATYTFTDILGMVAGVKGPKTTISTACSSSATAIGYAADWIKNGLCDLVITGGAESLSETTFSGFNSLRAVDELPCRPFDKNRKGISLGEGAAILILEEYEHALSRGMRPYAEVLGYGISGDAYHVTQPATDGSGIQRAMQMAFRMADCTRDEIEYINAHGTGTTANDLAETAAIKAFFGHRAYEIPVSSTKSMIGHCLGAAGAVEAVASLLPIKEGVIPPTANYREPDPECDLDYVPEPRSKRVDTVLSLSIAFGGNNTALILRRLS